MAVKRRVIWLSDEEWAILQAVARERHTTTSEIVRMIWMTAAASPPADPAAMAAEHDRVVARATVRLGHDPYREVHPAPKPGKR